MMLAMGFVFTVALAGVLAVAGLLLAVAAPFLIAGLVLFIIATVQKARGKRSRGLLVAGAILLVIGAIPALPIAYVITLFTRFFITLPFILLGVGFLIFCIRRKKSVCLPVLSLAVAAYFAVSPWAIMLFTFLFE